MACGTTSTSVLRNLSNGRSLPTIRRSATLTSAASGVDNLRVPLLSGVPRTVLLPGGEEAICVDIMFNPAVLYVAGADADAERPAEVADSGKPKIKRASARTATSTRTSPNSCVSVSLSSR